MPTLVLSFYVHLVPELLHLPVGVKVKVLHIDSAPTFFNLVHTVQTLAHQTKITLMARVVAFVPGAEEV